LTSLRRVTKVTVQTIWRLVVGGTTGRYLAQCLCCAGVENCGSGDLRPHASCWDGMATLTTSNNSFQGTQFIVASEVMHKFMGMVERVARHIGTVLIIGETGTGKERIAHAILEHSLRCSKPFVDINCAALPENLVESELFGYEKGAFSGADTDKPGLFELAHLGTVFLDEIGELDLKVQVKLLRVLDRAPYYRLGGHRKITADVRVVAATNRDLKEEVRAGRFRKDLYHRLSQFELCVPPLRDRPEDVLALANHFLAQGENGLKFSPDALRILQSYPWPGNVRELQNVVGKIMVRASGPEIGASEVRQELTSAHSNDHGPVESTLSDTRLDSLETQMEAQAIARALEATGGHRGQAAAQLGISRRTLSRKLREYGLSPARQVAPAGLGSLSYEQQQSFRAEVKLPVSLVTAESHELTCAAANLSAGGMGLEGLTTVLGYQSGLRVRFRTPGSDTDVEVLARLAWVGMHGRAGITFTDVSPAVRQEIKLWLHRKMAEEGWTVQPEPPGQSTD
jgi:DNA-binding NtrC family response regulator